MKASMLSERNKTWNLSINSDGSWDKESIQCQLLYDIREELKKLNNLLSCPNFVAIPRKLDSIRNKLPTKKKPKIK